MNARAPVRASTHLCASTRSFFAGSVGRGTAGDARRGGGALPAWRELQRTHRRASPARRGRGAWQWQTVRARLDVAVRPETYREELDVKIERARAHFQSRPADAKNPDGAAEIPLPTTEVFESARQNFRMRAEFRVWHEGDESFLAMFDSDDPKTPVEVPQFPMGSERINQLMPAILDEIKANEVLRKKLFQVNFLTTVKGDALVSMLYHRRLTEEWEEAANAARARLDVSIIGRSRKQKVRRSRARSSRRPAARSRAREVRPPRPHALRPRLGRFR